MSYKQQLKTYIDRNKLTINYEEKETNNKLFISRVIINGKEYEWSLEQQNKKTAKQEAAKIALNELNITEESLLNELNITEESFLNEESIKDILLDIRELLKTRL
tara:strand:- start:313 stop:627 length:315 start_codon:yes stop_codon:yes gene_type:complete